MRPLPCSLMEFGEGCFLFDEDTMHIEEQLKELQKRRVNNVNHMMSLTIEIFPAMLAVTLKVGVA